jgi:CheY-like chemotaxis protein
MSSLLVVDDEPSVRAIVSRWGASHGYEVVEAESAETALDRMRESAADIALCDLNMPGRNGRWLAERLHADYPHTAVVMTTGSDRTAAAAELPEGAIACLSKPFTLSELAGAMERALDWQLEQATARLWRPA